MTTSEKSGRLTLAGRGLLWSHLAATLLTAAEFVLLQAIAIGLTTGVYLMAPELDAGAKIGFADWLKVFQIVSPTLTVTAGAPIVISSYIYAKKAQEYYDFATQAAERAAQSDARANQSDARAELDRERANQSDARTEQYREQSEQYRERSEQAEAEIARLNARIAELENGAAPAHRQ